MPDFPAFFGVGRRRVEGGRGDDYCRYCAVNPHKPRRCSAVSEDALWPGEPGLTGPPSTSTSINVPELAVPHGPQQPRRRCASTRRHAHRAAPDRGCSPRPGLGPLWSASFHDPARVMRPPVRCVPMSTVRLTESPPARRHWLLATLAGALMLGVLAMHSMPAESLTPPSPPGSSVQYDVTDSGASSAHQKHDSEGSSVLQDCGALLAACLVLMIPLAGLIRWRRSPSRRVLWVRARPHSIDLGVVRTSLESLAPLQRTTVLRC